MAFQVNTFKKK